LNEGGEKRHKEIGKTSGKQLMKKTIIWMVIILLGGLMSVHAACKTNSVYKNCFVTDVDPDDCLNVRAYPKRQGPIVGMIPSDGQAVHKLEVAIFPGKSDWFKVCYKDIIGWVNAKYLICRLSPQAAEKIISHQAREVLLSLARRDLKQFSKHVHPLKGVRFSPYAYVMPKIDLRIGAKEIEGLFKDKEKKLWGYSDGFADEIRLTFEAYFSKYVYRHDFAKAEQIGYNTAIGGGNTRNNLFEAYPHSIFVEYYLDGLDPRTSGTEWASLRLVFEELEGKWFVVGVIYSRWTI
jgi:uncharacterized protein YraI